MQLKTPRRRPAWLSFLIREGQAKPVDPIAPQTDPEDLVAELAEAAYRFALRHGFQGPFIEVVLALMDALRACARGGSKSSRRPRRRPDHPPVHTLPSRLQHDRDQR
jgi:hypothetical protein